jgi:aminomethyltransferase
MSDDSSNLEKTVLHAEHVAAGAEMVDFGGWEMPMKYTRTPDEHLATRSDAGKFDVGHMGRFFFSGENAEEFLQYTTTNNVGALEVGEAQYTIIPNENGGAVDDAYLYKIGEQEFMLVVNASNREKDWDHFQEHLDGERFSDVELVDRTKETAMISLQGPNSEKILTDILTKDGNSGRLPEPDRNKSTVVTIGGYDVRIARTGYTGESFCFELVTENANAVPLWRELDTYEEQYGIKSVGLGARDTLRLESSLPLYGHELGDDMPIFAISLAKRVRAVSFHPDKGDYIGREELWKQAEERKMRDTYQQDYGKALEDRVLKRVVMPMAVLDIKPTKDGKGVFRKGYQIIGDQVNNNDGELLGQIVCGEKDPNGYDIINEKGTVIAHLTAGKKAPRNGFEVLNGEGEIVGHITSGSNVPYLEFDGDTVLRTQTEDANSRGIALGYIDSTLFPSNPGDPEREVFTLRDPDAPQRKPSLAYLVTCNMRSDAPPYASPAIHPEEFKETPRQENKSAFELLKAHAERTAENTRWRQKDCFNLIPSENTPSPLVRALLLCDAMGRYNEHKRVRGFGLASPDARYYQGTGFATDAEEKLVAELAAYFGASQIEPRPISGQQANMAVFSGIVQWLSRGRFKEEEPGRIANVMSNLLRNGGHLSQQWFGAMRDTVAINPSTGGPAVHPFPVLPDNPYMIDVDRTGEAIRQTDPRLIVVGKSMVLNPEPVREISQLLDVIYNGREGERPILMYDGAHVMGLLRPDGLQEPLKEGADILTGSLHKTYPGTQRGMIASNMDPGSRYEGLWNAIVAREFPGLHSNHHLGTLVAMLGAAYEMREYGDAYQQKVRSNAKAFASSLANYGIQVEGDPDAGYTQTHQVVINVGKCQGPRVAALLEQHNIIVNYNALPDDPGFSAASGIRMGVAEMTRFGMDEGDFDTLAKYMSDIIIHKKDIPDDVAKFRKDFLEMQYTLPREQAEPLI